MLRGTELEDLHNLLRLLETQRDLGLQVLLLFGRAGHCPCQIIEQHPLAGL